MECKDTREDHNVHGFPLDLGGKYLRHSLYRCGSWLQEGDTWIPQVTADSGPSCDHGRSKEPEKASRSTVPERRARLRWLSAVTLVRSCKVPTSQSSVPAEDDPGHVPG